MSKRHCGDVLNLFASLSPLLTIPAAILGLVEIAGYRAGGGRGALASAIGGFAAAVLLGSVVNAQARVARGNGTDLDYLATLLPGVGSPAVPTPQSATYMRSPYGALPVALYRPRQPRPAGSGPLPILVYVHGGGWVLMNNRIRDGDMQWFADRGYLVVSVEYDLSTDERHLWNLVQPEIGCALTWIAGNGARLGGDVSRIGMIGDSAGGNLVLTTSYAASGGRLQPACPGTLPRIRATIALYPVIDLAAMTRNPDLIVGKWAASVPVRYTGGSPTRYPDRYAAVTPATYIHPAAPPTLILAGDDDRMLNYPGPGAFVAAARQAGVPITSITFPFAGHSFDVAFGSIGNQLMRQTSLRFLRRHL